jgi:hypothetical protein
MIPGMGQGQIADVIALLSKRDFTWEFRVRKFVILDGNMDSNETHFSVDLQGD